VAPDASFLLIHNLDWSMKYILAAALACALIGCDTAEPPMPVTERHVGIAQDAIESPLGFLLSTSAKDFHTSALGAVRLRDVRLGHVMTPAGERQYLLCGEFVQAAGGEPADWVPFTTIKTSGYEQMFGAQASGLCERAAIVWEPLEDLSASLQTEIDSLR
jgi:hypothetical protein